MKSKLNFLIGNSLGRKVNTKWFKIVNILLAVAIVAICNIDSIINFFGGDFDKKQKIYVIDNTGNAFDTFKQQMMLTTSSKTEKDLNYEIILYNKDENAAKKMIADNKKDLVVEFDNDAKNVLAVKLISQEYIDLLDNQYLSNSIYNTKVMLAINKSNIPPAELANIYSKIDVQRVILDKSKNTEDESMEVIMSTVFPVVILPFFMLVIFLVQMIGAEVNEEKTTRGMEIIISSVSPATHFFSKIIASNLFVVIQGVLLFIYGASGLLIRSFAGGGKITGGMFSSITDMLSKALDTSFMDKLIYIIPLTLVLMLLTFLAYSLVAGVLASMTTNIEDYQQIQTPIMLVLVAGYYLAILAGTFKGAIFIKILSFVPFISAILSPSLLVLGQIGVFDVCISIALMIGTIYLLIKFGLKIYKVGILNYSSNKLWKKIFKAMKN
jgi:ABC-2 type transport system permease protein